jgi:predicted alpha/beta hydrolase family esterase
MAKSSIKVIMVHGNGGGTAEGGWFPPVARDLRDAGLHVINDTFPDNDLARAEVWLPHLEKLGADQHTIILGHSSGAVAALRFAERHKVLGSVIVGACYTDLGDEAERQSGYYDHAWDWPAIKANQRFILQYASVDDPYIPIEEARFIHEQVNSSYHEHRTRGHYEGDDFPELVPALQKQLAKLGLV